MSRKRIKKTKKQQPVVETPSRASKLLKSMKSGLESAKSGIQSAARSTSNAAKSVGSKTKEFVSNIKLGERMAQDVDNMAAAIKEAADKAELLEAANNLETQAKNLRAIAASL